MTHTYPVYINIECLKSLADIQQQQMAEEQSSSSVSVITGSNNNKNHMSDGMFIHI
jgi:hypothetical protein